MTAEIGTFIAIIKYKTAFGFLSVLILSVGEVKVAVCLWSFNSLDSEVAYLLCVMSQLAEPAFVRKMLNSRN